MLNHRNRKNQRSIDNHSFNQTEILKRKEQFGQNELSVSILVILAYPFIRYLLFLNRMVSPTVQAAHSPEKLQMLWAGVQQQDYQSLTDLYRQLYTDLINFGLLFGHDGSATKDAVNQIFLEIWERGKDLPPVENVRSYLITYLRRKLLREYEHNSRFSELTDSELVSQRSYEEFLVQTQQEEHIRQRLRAALAQLTPRQKELIEMRFFRGLSNDSICQETGMHINTVYNTISSALKILRQILGQEDYYNLLIGWPLLFPLLFQAELLSKI
jgi:RNA polymerase sigma-70 factor (ECF subfamily)